MLDQEIIQQLTDVFSKLENTVEIRIYNSTHEKQIELKEMLLDLAKASSKIKVTELTEESSVPRFEIAKTGVTFRGIPGGHEFSSLVLAILNTDLKGKIPDEGILQRVRNLKGPIRLKTYISLSCENCPDIVQTLNLMAILHPDFKHEMVDGEFAQDEIKSLSIQGVPSVVHQNKLISSGKISFIDLLTKLEKHFGSQSDGVQVKDLGSFDVVVVGGGPAGASAAIYAARKGLKTVIIADKVGGQVQDTKGIENLISVPYTEGPLLASKLSSHVAEYKIPVLEHRRVLSVETEQEKVIKLESGEFLKTKSLIVATGAKWRELGVPGEKEYIGRGVAFCPHCDGPYYRGKNIAVIGGGNSGVEAAIDLAGIVKSVTLFEFAPELKGDKILVDKLKSLSNVSIKTNVRTNEVKGDGEKVVGIEFEDRVSGELHNLSLDGVFVQIGLIPNSQFIKGVVETNKFGEIIIDSKCRTSVKGIYAAGDVSTVPFKQIIIAMGEGAKAALTAFEELVVG
jgi:alkyl hydroperoxide reductase subunit F